MLQIMAWSVKMEHSIFRISPRFDWICARFRCRRRFFDCANKRRKSSPISFSPSHKRALSLSLELQLRRWKWSVSTILSLVWTVTYKGYDGMVRLSLFPMISRPAWLAREHGKVREWDKEVELTVDSLVDKHRSHEDSILGSVPLHGWKSIVHSIVESIIESIDVTNVAIVGIENTLDGGLRVGGHVLETWNMPHLTFGDGYFHNYPQLELKPYDDRVHSVLRLMEWKQTVRLREWKKKKWTRW